MLLKDFYKYKIIEKSDTKLLANIKINPNHDIFKGHFPQQAIVPGVSQILMLKEILSDYLQVDLCLNSSKSIKFLAIIDPNKMQNLDLEITFKLEGDKYKVSAIISKNETKYLKFRGIYSGN